MSEQLIETFEPQEIETTQSLLECMDGAATSSKFRRIVMLLLRGHYSNPENYGPEYEHLKCFKWTGDTDSTISVGMAPHHRRDATVSVGLSHQNDDRRPEDYPGIYIGFGGVEFRKLALANAAWESEDNSQNYVAKQAVLTLLVNHVCREAGDAYDLADMSAMVLTALGRPFALKSGAQEFSIEGISEPKKELPAPNRYYAVAMTVKITYTLSVTRSIESHRLRRIAAMITLS
jgi:hypothetical protein